MHSRVMVMLGLTSVMFLAGCQKASEKTAERMIESALEKEGVKAKVDLSKGGVSYTATDASGKSSQLELGSSQVTESELGIALYPGTRPLEGSVTRASTPENTMVTVSTRSDDEPAKVAAFYREQMKGQAGDRQFVDTSSSDGAMLMLVDEKTRSSVQVNIQKSDQGTEIHIVTGRGK